MSTVAVAPGKEKLIKKKPLSWVNLAIGGAIQTFEVSTLGQPFEVIKTHMAANRGDGLGTAMRKIYARGGLPAFWTGLIPWAWIEASTKGAVLLFASSEIEYQTQSRFNLSPTAAGLLGGMGGGLAQAYTTMGFCTFMKTVEVTRHKDPIGMEKSTWSVAADVWRKEGIRGLNKGVTAVAVRQMTNWGSRFGISRLTERVLKGNDKDRKLSNGERILGLFDDI
ncbi:mitochondrial carrier domain-containing protein [Paraphysoderma sedebokerense]|nr:mitochondrial carrier domain-containing protein [Paraphysoderma sedebokerense]